MERTENPQEQLPDYEKLSSPEKTVYEILKSGKALPHDVTGVARAGNMSEMHAKVALQLLFLRGITEVNPEGEEI